MIVLNRQVQVSVMDFKLGVLFVCLISTALAKPQISFGEEEEVPQSSNPVAPEEVPSTVSDSDNELVQTRLGLLAGYLSKRLFFNAKQSNQNDINDILILLIYRFGTHSWFGGYW